MNDRKSSEKTARSEGARHLIALLVVAAAVAAQSLVTKDAVADQNRQANDFGVRLLATELSAPVSPVNRKPLVPTPTPTDAKPFGSAAVAVASITEPTTVGSVRKPGRAWLEVLQPFELRRRTVAPYHYVDRELLNRDGVGSLIELTDKDVLNLVVSMRSPPWGR